jgi:hypothetical protein
MTKKKKKKTSARVTKFNLPFSGFRNHKLGNYAFSVLSSQKLFFSMHMRGIIPEVMPCIFETPFIVTYLFRLFI